MFHRLSGRQSDRVFHRPAWRHAAGRPVVLRRTVVAVAAAAALLFAGVAVGADRGASSAAIVGGPDCPSTVGDGLTPTSTSKQVIEGMTFCKIGFVAGTGTWTVPAGVTQLFVWVVAGGGGGGNFGGGGGGQVIVGKPMAVTGGSPVTVTVGAGGVGGTDLAPPTNGADSVFGTFIAKGGGAGGSMTAAGVGSPGADGGNGGGGAPDSTGTAGAATGAAGGAAIATADASGNAGGSGAGATSNGTTGVAGGGGGSSRFVGEDGVVAWSTLSPSNINYVNAGYGGFGDDRGFVDGLTWDCTGRPVCTNFAGGFGEGGPGGSQLSGTPTSAGAGDTGRLNTGCIDSFGTFPDLAKTKPAQVNTGQGGAGGCGVTVVGGNGGSGMVVVRYRAGGVGTPGAPTGVTGTAGTGSADVEWTAPASDGGSAITGYAVEQSTDGGATWVDAPMCTGTALACTVTGLTNGTGYVFRVSATNDNGTGPWSDPSETVTPGTGPRFTG